MANTTPVVDTYSFLRRQSVRWNGHNFMTNGGGTKYMDGPVSDPAHAAPCKQAVVAGRPWQFVVNFVTNPDTGGNVTFELWQQTPGGSPAKVGEAGPFAAGETGIKSATTANFTNAWAPFDGTLLWVEVVSDSGVNSNDGTAYAVLDFYADLAPTL